MSEEISQIKTDVALLKQEVHHLREIIKSGQALFRWAMVVVVTAIITAVMNLVIGGDIAK